MSNVQGTLGHLFSVIRKDTNKDQACEDTRIAEEDIRIKIPNSASFPFKENAPISGVASDGKSKNKTLTGVDVAGYLTVIPKAGKLRCSLDSIFHLLYVGDQTDRETMDDEQVSQRPGLAALPFTVVHLPTSLKARDTMTLPVPHTMGLGLRALK